MNRHVNAIAGRLSLRPPQRRSLEILDRVTEIAPPKKGADVEAALVSIRSEFPSVADFEREFPSLCFALATGVGKTRLMGAFISYQRDIARFIHAQMQEHYWEEVGGYEVKVSKGFTELKQRAYTHTAQEPPADYRISPEDKSNMAKYLFGGFTRCLYSEEKFGSDAERRLAVILEREAIKWFKPAKGQFQIFYRQGADQPEYQPDFVAESSNTVYMLEPKMRKEFEDPIVLAKKEAAVKWCANASAHAASYGGKPWRYLLIPHDEIAENVTLSGLAAQFGA